MNPSHISLSGYELSQPVSLFLVVPIYLWVSWFYFLTTEQYSIVYIYHIFIIHSYFEGHLYFFQFLAILKRAAMEMVEPCLCSRIEYPLGICPVYVQYSWTLSLIDCHNHEETQHWFLQWLYNVHSHQQWMSVLVTLYPY